MVSVDTWIENLKRHPPEILTESELRLACEKVKEILVEESNLILITAPVIICGDIHGQFSDLLELFDLGGPLPDQQYLFLGDYVDRGYQSVETFEYLILLKLKYPSKINLLRGNHESRQTNRTYGFYDECLQKYGNSNAWKYFTEIFDYLTVGALIEGRIFCVHGGLSPEISSLDQLRDIQRVQEIPHSGAYVDLVWSDPDIVDTWKPSPRGAGYLFGQKITKKFNILNDLDLIARAHQLVMQGFKYMFHPDNSLITVWSAPNYCYRSGNVASFLRIDENFNREIQIFEGGIPPFDYLQAKSNLPYFT